MPRTVTLVLCDRRGTVFGALPAFDVEQPWWPEAGDVVATARHRHGVDVTILRLLSADRDAPPGGAVTYLAELEGAPPPGLLPAGASPLTDHPRRQTWAMPGGWRGDVDWAVAELRRAGRPPTGPPAQIRTWNLSSVWRIPVAGDHAWLKVVPPFFAHEGAMLQRVRIGPPLIAADGPRVLLAEVPGEDLHRPSRDQVATLVDLLVGEQVRWIDRTAELLALGLPDWRAEVFVPLASDVVSRTADQLDPGTVTAAGALVEDLPRRFADLASCGVPDTLVHGDFHAGNARGDEEHCVVLDWGDSGVGHPLLDMAAAVEPLAPELVRVAQEAWTAAWRHAVPGCDPPRAAALVAPVAALRQAVIYRHFLDHIEPAEQPYHRADPARWIIRAVSSVVSARGARGT